LLAAIGVGVTVFMARQPTKREDAAAEGLEDE
jgi:hypothetical protein